MFDLGQDMVGHVRLLGSAPAGTTVRIRHAEMLNSDGTLYCDNLRTALQTDYSAFAGARVYATFGQFGNFYGIGRSLDHGKSWTVLGGSSSGLPALRTGGTQPLGVYARPDAPDHVWAVIKGTLYASTDGGDHWNSLPRGSSLGWIAGDPRNPKRFLVSSDNDAILTEDGGSSFRPVGGPRRAGRVTADGLGRFYVACGGDHGGVWRFDGNVWTRILDEPWTTNVAVDPTDANRIAVTTNMDLFRDFSSATGAWISADGGRSWSTHNDGLAMLRGYVIAFNPHDTAQLIFGSFGRGYFVTHWSKGYAPIGTRTYSSTAEDVAFAQVGGPPVGLPQLRNGDMSAGTNVPEGWDGKWVGQGTIVVARDTNVVKNSTASLCVSSQGGPAMGQAYQVLDGSPGQTFTLNGYVRSAGVVKVNVAVQSFNGSWSPISFQQAAYVQDDHDWMPFSKDITLPDGTAHFGVVLLLDGTGQAWLDSVTISRAVN